VVLRLPDFTENSDKSTHPLQAFCSLNAWSRALYAQKHAIGLGTLVPWPSSRLIILFSEMLKFLEIISSKSKNKYCETS
jgi:hypothetical protein